MIDIVVYRISWEQWELPLLIAFHKFSLWQNCREEKSFSGSLTGFLEWKNVRDVYGTAMGDVNNFNLTIQIWQIFAVYYMIKKLSY